MHLFSQGIATLPGSFLASGPAPTASFCHAALAFPPCSPAWIPNFRQGISSCSAHIALLTCNAPSHKRHSTLIALFCGRRAPRCTGKHVFAFPEDIVLIYFGRLICSLKKTLVRRKDSYESFDASADLVHKITFEGNAWGPQRGNVVFCVPV